MTTERPMELQVNGQARLLDVESPSWLARVLEALSLRPDRVAVELNGRIVPRARWSETAVEHGDKLEIVHFVGGGSGPWLPK